MGKMDIHICHMYLLIFVNDGNGFVIGSFLDDCIQLFDDWHQLRNNCLQISFRPFFQGFCKDCMVRVSADICDDGDCFFEFNSFFFQETNEFWNDHGWVSVIDLDCCIVSKIVEVASAFHTFFENELGSGTDHQVLLVDAKHTSCIITVIWVEEQCKILGNIRLVK